MIDGKNVPAVDLLDLANSVQQLERVGDITRLRRSVRIGHGENLERASILAADHAPGFVRSVASYLRDELFKLVAGKCDH